MKTVGVAPTITPSGALKTLPTSGASAGAGGDETSVEKVTSERLKPVVLMLVTLLATTSRARSSALSPVAPM